LDAFRARGHFMCGVNTGLLGFASQDDKGNWPGFDADFYRVATTAVLGHPRAAKFLLLVRGFSLRPIHDPEKFGTSTACEDDAG